MAGMSLLRPPNGTALSEIQRLMRWRMGSASVTCAAACRLLR